MKLINHFILFLQLSQYFLIVLTNKFEFTLNAYHLMIVFSLFSLLHQNNIFQICNYNSRIDYFRKLIKLIKFFMNHRFQADQQQLTSKIYATISQKKSLNKVNTHKIISNHSLLQSIKQYDNSIKKTIKSNKGLNRVQTSLISNRKVKYEMKADKNNDINALYNKSKTYRVNSVHQFQRQSSKQQQLMVKKQFMIEKQGMKLKTIDNKLNVNNIQKQISTIKYPKNQQLGHIQSYKLQSNIINEFKKPIQILKDPLQRKLKIFRQKFKMGQHINKKRQNDCQHNQIQKIVYNLQKQNLMKQEDDKMKKQGSVNSVKEENNSHLYHQSNQQKQKIKNKIKRQQRQQQKKIALHKFQQSSLLKLSLNQKLQMNLDYLNKKPLLKGRYQILEKLGKGLSGQVFKAKDILSDRLVAVKVIINNMKEEEYSFYKQNEHKNIVSYYNNFVQNSTRYLILQYFPYTLQSYTRKFKLNQNQIKIIFKSIVCGLSFLHAMSIAHRDIKLNNIVLSQNLQHVKFIDFGLCIDVAKCQNQLTKQFCGTIRYMPPEILQKRPYNPKIADIWSLGVVLYFLVHSRYPYNGRSEFDMLEKLSKGKLIIKEELDDDLKQLIGGMLKKKQLQRFSIIEILQSKWLN